MNLNLASMYGTPGADAAAAEEQEKVAQTELFCKLAAENNIDLNQFNDEQIQELWNSTFSKAAEEEKKENPFAKKDGEHEKKESKEEEKEEHEKEAAAAAEFEATKVAQAKLAEADYLGRVMAHAYVQELGQIGSAMGQDKEAGAKELLARFKGRAGEVASKAKEHAGAAASKAKEHAAAGAAKARQAGSAAKEHVKSHAGSYSAGAGLAAGGGAGYAAGKHKKASALDELAAELAVEKAASAGWDVEQVAERVNAVLTLGGPGESEKIAAAADLDGAREIRALEFLEAAGYPVQWDEQA